MKTLASILLWVLIAMSPEVLEAFSQITGAQIVSGVMDLQEGGVARIEAVGLEKGILVRFNCLWAGGRPVWIGKWALRGEI